MIRENADPAAPARGVRLFGLSKYYGDVRALDDVDLEIKGGEFLTLLGPSGSGKSTILMALAGFLRPTHGKILVGDRLINDLAPEKRDFGVVFQGYALFPHMTVGENVAYPLKVRKWKRADINTKVQEALELVQLGPLRDRLPAQLSGGQQQRVALARALVFSPEVLLLDEPMGALDKKLRHSLQAELRLLHRRLGRTFINVTHDQEEAMAMSDRIAIMRAGKIIQVDEPRVLYDAPRSRFVADFLGKSNFITGKVTDVKDDVASVETPDGVVLHCVKRGETKLGGVLSLLLRPQKLIPNCAYNARAAVVETAIFQGTHVELALRCQSGHVLIANWPIGAFPIPGEGEAVHFGWKPESTLAVTPD